MNLLPAVNDASDFDALADWLHKAGAAWREAKENRRLLVGEFFYNAACVATEKDYKRLILIAVDQFDVGSETIGRWRHQYQTENQLPPPSPKSLAQAKRKRTSEVARLDAPLSDPGGAVPSPTAAEQEPPPGFPAPAPPAPSVDESSSSPATRVSTSADPGAGDSSTLEVGEAPAREDGGLASDKRPLATSPVTRQGQAAEVAPRTDREESDGGPSAHAQAATRRSSSLSSAEPSDSAAPAVRGSTQRSAAPPDASAHGDAGDPRTADPLSPVVETKRRVGTPSRVERPSAAVAGGHPGPDIPNAILALRFAAPEKIAISADLPELEQLAERIRQAIRLHARSVNGDLTRREVETFNKRKAGAR